MGVGIDEARGDPASACVDFIVSPSQLFTDLRLDQQDRTTLAALAQQRVHRVGFGARPDDESLHELAEGRFENISPDDLRELLGDAASQSLILIRDLESTLRDRGRTPCRRSR